MLGNGEEVLFEVGDVEDIGENDVKEGEYNLPLDGLWLVDCCRSTCVL